MGSCEFGSMVTTKSVEFTTSVSIVALEPEIFIVIPLTLRTVSVVRVTSLYAANASEGSKNAMTIPIRVSNFFIMMNRYKL